MRKMPKAFRNEQTAICLRRLLGETGNVKYQKGNETKQNAEIVNHLHESYWNVCNELEVTISKQGRKRKIGVHFFSFKLKGRRLKLLW